MALAGLRNTAWLEPCDSGAFVRLGSAGDRAARRLGGQTEIDAGDFYRDAGLQIHCVRLVGIPVLPGAGRRISPRDYPGRNPDPAKAVIPGRPTRKAAPARVEVGTSDYLPVRTARDRVDARPPSHASPLPTNECHPMRTIQEPREPCFGVSARLPKINPQ